MFPVILENIELKVAVEVGIPLRAYLVTPKAMIASAIVILLSIIVQSPVL